MQEKSYLKEGLVIEAMSPEISEVEDNLSSDDDANVAADTNEAEKNQRSKRIVCYPLRWRSNYLEEILKSLDRKWVRRSTEKARSMVKKRYRGATKHVQPPHEIPDWAVRRDADQEECC